MKLSCYLLRGSQRPSDVLRSTDADVRHYRGNDNQGWEQVESLTEAQQLSNRLAAVYRTTSREPSDWQSMVAMWEEGVDPAANDFAIEERQDRGAVFFFNVGNPPQWIAWSFGRAWRYLLRSKLNPRFGVIAALNDLTAAEDEAVFRKLQVRRQSGVPQVVGRATFGDAPIGAFELDAVWDAIKSIGGRTPDGNMVYGSLSLVESHPITGPNELEPLSVLSLDKFRGTRYRDRFGFLDQYIPVSDESNIAELDSHVARLLLADPSTVAFAHPSAVASFGSRDMAVTVAFPGEPRSAGRTAVGSAVIASHSRLRNHDDQINLDSTLRFYSEEGLETRADLRECLASQFVIDDVTYVLADGVYFEVDRNFVASLDNFLGPHVVELVSAPVYRSRGETDWLDSAATTGQFLKLHPTTFSPTGQIGNVELADLVAADGRLLHVKVGADTAAAAEVSRQAMSAAEALLMYPDTRKWLEQSQLTRPFAGLQSTLESFPRPAIGIVLLGRASDNMSRVSLFAKLALERAVRHLEGRNFAVRIHFVPNELGD
ncbi:hypothetical protein BMS3Bbin01_02450 [bacterium BMS3Bbin01]|nr:hypothetical protein BMS3Bbin01_02450 [bacterium BMS3Bbin01]